MAFIFEMDTQARNLEKGFHYTDPEVYHECEHCVAKKLEAYLLCSQTLFKDEV